MHPMSLAGCAAFFVSLVLLTLWEFVSVRYGAWFRFSISVVAIIGALLATGESWIRGGQLQLGLLVLDRFGCFFAVLILAATLIALGLTKIKTVSYAFILLSALSALIAVFATDLIAIYLGVTGFALSSLMGLATQGDHRLPREILIKYFFSLCLMALFFVYGTMLLYWGSGETSLAGIQVALTARPLDRFETLGLVFLLSGIAYLMAWVPFHFVTADVYTDSQPAALGFHSVVGKLIGLTIVLRLASQAGFFTGIDGHHLIMAGSMVTMIVGNLQALAETNLKRRMAFAVAAQVGFMMLGLTAIGADTRLNESAYAAVAIYSVAYTVMTMGAFAVMTSLGRLGRASLEVSDLIGLARQRPWLAAAFALFLFSLSGLPLTVGFIAKYHILKTVIQSQSWLLALIASINWAISAYYYFDIILSMYFKEPRELSHEPTSYLLVAAIFSCAVVTVYWGIFPGQMAFISTESIRSLLF